MDYNKKILEVKDSIKKIRYLESMENYLYTDMWYTTPKDGFEYEAEVSNYASELKHEKITDKSIGELLEEFASLEDKDYKSDIDRGMVRYLDDIYKEASQIPVELQTRFNKSCITAKAAWEKGFKSDDFEAVKPFLKEQIEVLKEIAKVINPNESPYQVLVRRNDDFDLEEIDSMFNEIKKEIQFILKETIDEVDKIDTSFLNVEVSKETKMKLVNELQNFIGVDWNKMVMYEDQHPVCTLNGPRDSRPSANYDDLIPVLLSSGHESGHGIYNYNASDEVVEAGLWGGPEGAMHESQAKFYENLVCRTPEFWNAFYPILQRYVPEFKDIPVEKMVLAINKPKIKLKRLSSDELTTPLHIIIRYELEKEIFEGDIEIEELPNAWNAKYKEYLGIEPSNYREGILQDVHWYSGYIGYFQGYVLGEVYASQFQHKMLKDYPKAYEKLAKGDMTEINNWIKDNVHSHGFTYDVAKTIEIATGEKLNVKYYLENLRKKFL